MELAIKINKNKSLKKILCLMLCILIMALTFHIDCIKVKAAIPLVLAAVVIPDTIMVIGAILVACGITFTLDYAIERTAEKFFSDADEPIKAEIIDVAETAEQGVAEVPDTVWDYAVDWTQENFNVGENNTTSSYFDGVIETYVEEEIVTDYLPVNYQVPICELPVGLPQIFTIGQDTYEVVISGGVNKYARLWKNGEAMSNCMSTSINLDVPWFIYLEKYLTDSLRFRLRRAKSGSEEWEEIDSHWPIVDNVAIANVPATMDIPYIGQNVLDIPNWDIKDQTTGKREIGFPITGTGSLDDLLDDTWEDVANPDTTGDDPMVPPIDPSWLEGLLDGLIGGIQGLLGNIWQWLQNFWNNLLQKLGEALQPLADILSNILAKIMELISSVAGVNVNTLEADMTLTARNYKIPDLFILILKVILACFRLILRASIFAVSLSNVPATTELLNTNIVLGIDFLKNQQLPVFGISYFNLVSIVFTLLFGLKVAKKIRRTYRA